MGPLLNHSFFNETLIIICKKNSHEVSYFSSSSKHREIVLDKNEKTRAKFLAVIYVVKRAELFDQ